MPFMSDSQAVTTELGRGVTAQGRVNYMGIYIGFYGKTTVNGSYDKTFTFSDPVFQGSSFKFEMSAGA